MTVDKKWVEKGYIDEPVADGVDLAKEIRNLCKEKNAVILAHYYTTGDIQQVSDFICDSLALAEDLKKFKEEHPGYKVVSYVNTTAAVKALTDVVVTSGNAKKIVDTFSKDEKLIFGPDYNLGSYINSVTGRNMLLWNGGCHVHERFSAQEIVRLKKEHPGAEVLVHPECKGPVVALADVVGSTAVLLKHAVESDTKEFIVATESGILYEMTNKCPEKTFIPVPPEVSEGSLGCSCNECDYMKMNTLRKIYNALKCEWPTVEVAPEIARDAVKPIERMLELS